MSNTLPNLFRRQVNNFYWISVIQLRLFLENMQFLSHYFSELNKLKTQYSAI